MDDFVEEITRGNVSGVKILLATVVLALAVGYEDGVEHAAGEETGRATLHVVGGTLVVVVLGIKVVAVRWWRALGRYLPAIGLTLFGLLALTWATSAGDYFFRELGMSDARKYTVQLIGSLLVGLLIVIVTISIVTAKLGPRLDRREELRELEEVRDERQDQREERGEERQELREERDGG